MHRIKNRAGSVFGVFGDWTVLWAGLFCEDSLAVGARSHNVFTVLYILHETVDISSTFFGSAACECWRQLNFSSD